jgi:hypothetical protein
LAGLPEAERRELAECQARAWANAAYAHAERKTAEGAAAAEACARRIAELALPFAGLPEAERRELQQRADVAWQAAADAYKAVGNAEASRHCADRLNRSNA